MGTWGAGNFENDGALDYLDSIIDQLLKTIGDCLSPEKRETFDLDWDGFRKAMPSADIVISLCEHYGASVSVKESTVREWRNTFLHFYNEKIDDYGIKCDYKIERRTVIEETFAKLEALAHDSA